MAEYRSGNLSLHLNKLHVDLARLIPNDTFEGYCLLDYEQWRADWNSTGAAYRSLSLKDAGGNAATAQSQYEAAAQRWFLATIQAVRSVRPGCRVGWYGYPTNALPHTVTPAWTRYCKEHPGLCWFDVGGDGIGNGYLGPGAATQRAHNDKLSWLFKALDAITPSVYLGIPASETTPANATAYVRSTVQEAVRVAAGKPVVPVVWHHYDNYWEVKAPAPRQLLTPEDLTLEIATPLRAGAHGVLVWGHVGKPADAAALQRYADGPLRDTVTAVCKEFACCTSDACLW